MLMIVSESLSRTQTLIEVAREFSLNLSYFRSAEKLASLMGGRSRRFILLAEDDVSQEIIASLAGAGANARFGLIICADREALRSSNRAEQLEELSDFDNVEWLSPDYSVDSLSAAARKCRRRMLTLGKDELEEAILKRQFFIQYQPKVERNAGTEWLTREAEALIRWHHPKHGLLGPLEFLPEAEAFDLIGPISELVLYEAAAQLVKWREQGLNLNSCINLASSQLTNADLPGSYERIVRKHNLECSNFTFEVTEQDVANSEAPHLRVLKQLRERGFRISLDDFGVATSSLGTFEQLPFDEIKIHAKALARARQNPVALKVLAAVTGLAHNLGISVCAEGVEDQETFEFLKTIECDKMQGFLISEAVMPDIIRRVYSAKSKDVEDVA
ncbi:MAG: EAL domain-containing protein (putative c-di-GMP-specific phosphodiesterase class I) [Woeseiaceae bacterium]|jgi:EAL domain-containing protein (putative c-di-GMP-specific phosphodiesterase class I)